MTVTTAEHAHNLFTLVMDNRHGPGWRSRLSAEEIMGAAEEIATEFAATRDESPASNDAGSDPGATVWTFPDGSKAAIERAGLRRLPPAESQAAE